MLWRLWAFVCGVPVGAAIGLAAFASPAPRPLALAALAGGGLLTVVVGLLARRDAEPERGRHLAAAASTAWFAAAAAVAIYFAWAPGPWAWAATPPVVLALALLRGSRDPGPARGALGWALRALASAALGGVAVVAIAAALAALSARPIARSTRFASVLYAVDASVVTRPIPVCGRTPLATRVLRESGANPALTPDDRQLFFDEPAASDGGRRQIHRLDRSNGDIVCWTCGDPGNNVRPSLNSAGVSLAFESDRDATWRHLDEREIYLAGVAERADVADRGRRLSFLPGPDTHPVFGPGPQMLTWSHREAGRQQVVSAPIRSGHGGIMLGSIGVLADAGGEWIAPLAWSNDGRSLVVVRGNPFAALEGRLLDPAVGEERALGAGVGLGAGTDGDGAWLAFTTTHSHHPAGALPKQLGFALASLAERGAGAYREGTGIRIGSVAKPGEAETLVLPDDLASWGEPTGLAQSSDASTLVLGQRRATPSGRSERLVEITLECSQVATAPREVAAVAR